MPVIDIPDNLAFTKDEALKALEAEVNRQQQQTRERILLELRTAAAQVASSEMVPDDQLAAHLITLRDTLAGLRQEFQRLGRVEASFRQQWQGGAV